jgi:hypothetical protein
MKKTPKKGPSRASKKKAVRDLAVKPAKGRTIRGGIAFEGIKGESTDKDHKDWVG